MLRTIHLMFLLNIRFSIRYSFRTGHICLVINNMGTIWHAGGLPLFCFHSFKENNSGVINHRKAVSEAVRDWQTVQWQRETFSHLAKAFPPSLQGHPASLIWSIPTSLFFLLNFPILWSFFSLACSVWLWGLYPISDASFFMPSSCAPIEFVLFS